MNCTLKRKKSVSRTLRRSRLDAPSSTGPASSPRSVSSARPREQLGGPQEDRSAILPRCAVPILPGCSGRLDRLLHVLRAALVHGGEDVLLVVRHHRVEGLACSDFLAADDHRRLDLLGRHLLKAKPQLCAFRRSRRIGVHRLVLGSGRAKEAWCCGHRGDCRLADRARDVSLVLGRRLGRRGGVARRPRPRLARAAAALHWYTRARARSPHPFNGWG